ncbi:hypothetical protein Tco_0529843 [Tanacetum coccineum]
MKGSGRHTRSQIQVKNGTVLQQERMRQPEWRIKGSWVPSGKAHTGLQKRSRMALTSCKQWRTRQFLGLGTRSTYTNAICRYGTFIRFLDEGLINHSEGPSPSG